MPPSFAPYPLQEGVTQDNTLVTCAADVVSMHRLDRERMYEATTEDIVVRVEPAYARDRSDPETGQHFWTYDITIENGSASSVQLMRRYWLITDGMGRRHEVKGQGVVGEQPIIPPGQSYRYTSGCPLPTRHGFMQGSYAMVDEDGRTFDITIPLFSLDIPEDRKRLN
jgi:ApaG protein